MSALPYRSDLHLFGYGQRVIDLDAKIPNGALDRAMTKEELHGPQVACTPVDQGGLGSIQSESCPGNRAKILSDQHIEDLLAYASCSCYPQRNRLVVLLSVTTELCAGEIAALTWETVLEAADINVVRGI